MLLQPKKLINHATIKHNENLELKVFKKFKGSYIKVFALQLLISGCALGVSYVIKIVFDQIIPIKVGSALQI